MMAFDPGLSLKPLSCIKRCFILQCLGLMVKIYPTLPCMAPLTIQEPSNLDSEPSDQLISQPRESPFQSSSSEQATEQLIEQEKDNENIHLSIPLNRRQKRKAKKRLAKQAHKTYMADNLKLINN